MQIDADTSCSCWQYEQLLVAIWVLEVFYSFISIFSWRLAINSAVLVAPDAQEVIENIQEPSHLTENEDFAILTQ